MTFKLRHKLDELADEGNVEPPAKINDAMVLESFDRLAHFTEAPVFTTREIRESIEENASDDDFSITTKTVRKRLKRLYSAGVVDRKKMTVNNEFYVWKIGTTRTAPHSESFLDKMDSNGELKTATYIKDD